MMPNDLDQEWADIVRRASTAPTSHSVWLFRGGVAAILAIAVTVFAFSSLSSESDTRTASPDSAAPSGSSPVETTSTEPTTSVASTPEPCESSELERVVAELRNVPYRQLVDPIAPSSIESMRELGFGEPAHGRVIEVTPVFANPVLFDEELENLTPSDVAWDGYLVTIELASGNTIEAPVPVALGPIETITALRAAPDELSIDLGPLVGACALVMEGTPGAEGLELGVPTIVAVGASAQATAIPFEPQFERLVGDQTIENLLNGAN